MKLVKRLVSAVLALGMLMSPMVTLAAESKEELNIAVIDEEIVEGEDLTSNKPETDLNIETQSKEDKALSEDKTENKEENLDEETTEDSDKEDIEDSKKDETEVSDEEVVKDKEKDLNDKKSSEDDDMDDLKEIASREESILDKNTDSDGDGLCDYLEEEMGCDPYKADTDDDGLNDYIEIMLGLDPTIADTDDNGICDADEDTDGDGLSNITEVNFGSDPSLIDTDNDGADDNAEKLYGGNPTVADTDGDGADDGFEIAHGTDPSAYNAFFSFKLKSADGKVWADIIAKGQVAANSQISEQEVADSLGAYENKKYELKAPVAEGGENSFVKATVYFSTDAKFSDKATIYRYNEENVTDTMDALTTWVLGGQAKAVVKNGGSFILKSRKEVDNTTDDNTQEVENTVLVQTTSEGVDMTQNGAKDSNNDGISDEYTKLLCEGKILTGAGEKVFGDCTFEEIQRWNDFDGDGIVNSKEITIAYQPDGTIYAKLSSSPIMADSDGDGISDLDDDAPFERGMKGGIIGTLRIIGRHTPTAIFAEGHSYLVFTSYVDDQKLDFSNIYNGFSFNREVYGSLSGVDETTLSWTTSVDLIDSDDENNVATRKNKADEMWQVLNNEANPDLVSEMPVHSNLNLAESLNRGEYISIGNYTHTGYADGMKDAIFKSQEIGTMAEIEALKATIDALTGEDISIYFVMSHFASLAKKVAFESYTGHDVMSGETIGGIWFNREMYNQKFQYTQCPNQIYEVEITQKQLDDMMNFLSENNYYNVLSHNCSSVSTGAWNIATGFVRDGDGNLVTDAAGKYIKNDLNLSARGTGVFRIIDTPGTVCEQIASLAANDSATGNYVGENLRVVKGSTLKGNSGVDREEHKPYIPASRPQIGSVTEVAPASSEMAAAAEVEADNEATVIPMVARTVAATTKKVAGVAAKNQARPVVATATTNAANQNNDEAAVISEESVPLAHELAEDQTKVNTVESKIYKTVAFWLVILLMGGTIVALLFYKKYKKNNVAE